jgi:dihydrofolate reductase
MINLIVAFDENYTIGNKGKLIWHCSEDLKHFKSITTNHIVVMGRKTFESIGKPLSNRINIVLSQSGFEHPGVITMKSVEEVLNYYNVYPNCELFIIGGAEIYRLFFSYVERMYITRIHETFEGDTAFFKFNLKQWELKSIKDIETNQFKITFEIWEKW